MQDEQESCDGISLAIVGGDYQFSIESHLLKGNGKRMVHNLMPLRSQRWHSRLESVLQLFVWGDKCSGNSQARCVLRRWVLRCWILSWAPCSRQGGRDTVTQCSSWETGSRMRSIMRNAWPLWVDVRVGAYPWPSMALGRDTMGWEVCLSFKIYSSLKIIQLMDLVLI